MYESRGKARQGQITKDIELSGLNEWICSLYLPSRFLLSHQNEGLSKSKQTSESRRAILNILFSNRETPQRCYQMRWAQHIHLIPFPKSRIITAFKLTGCNHELNRARL